MSLNELPKAKRIQVEVPTDNSDVDKSRVAISHLLKIVSTFAKEKKACIQFDKLVKINFTYFFLFTGPTVYELSSVLCTNGFSSSICDISELTLNNYKVDKVPLVNIVPHMWLKDIHSQLYD